MVKIGQKVKFDPYKGIHVAGAFPVHATLTGTVIEIFKDHGWFSVEYEDPEGKKRRTSFKFQDVGDTVKIE
jgi:hypothetical protein